MSMLTKLEGASKERARQLLDSIVLIRKDGFGLLARSGWVALPQESGGHFSDEDIVRIKDTLNETNEQEFFVVELGTPDSREPRFFAGPSSLGALEEINTTFGPFDIAIYPRSGSWAMLASEADFVVALGPPLVAARLIGAPLDEAVPRFRKYVDSWDSDPPAHLKALAALHWDEYQDLQPGDQYLLPMDSFSN